MGLCGLKSVCEIAVRNVDKLDSASCMLVFSIVSGVSSFFQKQCSSFNSLHLSTCFLALQLSRSFTSSTTHHPPIAVTRRQVRFLDKRFGSAITK